MTSYRISLLKDPSSNSLKNLLADIDERVMPAVKGDGVSHYGAFAGLFGLASNEAYVITNCADDSHPDIDGALTATGLTLLNGNSMTPTVRPTDHGERTTEGIYVFRWFEVWNRDVELIVNLSQRAWLSFEEGFDTQVQGLFREETAAGDMGQMLLLTRYTSLAVWEDSRTPSVEARELFRQRHELMAEAKPFCTRLHLR
jgi:hypothetical protein